MSRKLFFVMILTLVIMGMINVAVKVQRTEANGTIYIRATGEVEGTDKIERDGDLYTFIDNINDSIVVERDNIVLDGAGYTLEGTEDGWSNGIYVSYRSNVTINNMEIRTFDCGISLDCSSSNVITGNHITNNFQGFELYNSSKNCIAENNITNGSYGIRMSGNSNNNSIFENNITDNAGGITLYDSSNNTISKNELTNNTVCGVQIEGFPPFNLSYNNTLSGNHITNSFWGILLDSSYNNTLSENVMNNNKYNFYVFGHELSHFMHSIDVSNLVDGKPVYYLVNQKDMLVSPATYPQVGYLALVNCSNITVEDLNLTKNGPGLALANTNNSRITHNNITNNGCFGVMLMASYNNTISANNITNTMSGMPCVPTHDWSRPSGIFLLRSSNNTVSANNVTSNPSGLILTYCSNNTISGNNVTANREYGVCLIGSLNNMLRSNRMADNLYNFRIEGRHTPGDFFNDVDDTNTVDGKPIYYWVNRQDAAVPLDAGYVALVNCTHITVKDLNLTNHVEGLLVAFTNNSRIIGNQITNNSMDGIWLYNSSNNTISGNNITNNNYGIDLYALSNLNNVCGNYITNNSVGAYLYPVSFNNIVGNHITNNSMYGLAIFQSSFNSIIQNEISHNKWGIGLGALANVIYQNNFIDNSNDVSGYPDYANFLDNGIEGNYWSEYNGTDADHDGIGDTSYSIDEYNTDNYPLMGMFHSFNTSLALHVNVISNSTIEDFQYFEFNSTIKMHVFNMTANQTFGFCRVCIPHALMNVSNISVIIDDGLTPVVYPNYTLYDSGTHRWIYFAYPHSIHKIDIIPEFPSFLILPLFIIATLPAAIVYRRRSPNHK